MSEEIELRVEFPVTAELQQRVAAAEALPPAERARAVRALLPELIALASAALDDVLVPSEVRVDVLTQATRLLRAGAPRWPSPGRALGGLLLALEDALIARADEGSFER